MTSPVTAATASGSQTSSVQSHPITLPAGISAGHLLLVVFTSNANSGADPGYRQTGTDWHMQPSVARAGIAQVAFWKIAAGSDALTVETENLAVHSSHVSYRITGHGSAVQSASASGSSTNADPPSATLSGTAQDNLCIAACGNVGTVVASAAPAGYSNLVTKAGDASGFSTSTAEKALTASNTENPGVFTTTTTAWVAQTLIVASTTVATNTRATQEAVESISAVDPNLVMTQETVEVLSSNVLNLIMTQEAVEMVSTNVPDDSRQRPVVQVCA